MITVIAATSDKHCGSALGLCPRYFERVDGDAYRANKAQNWAYRKWLSFWPDVAAEADALRQRYPDEDVQIWAVNVGDNADKDARGIERVTNNPAGILRLAVTVHQPMVETASLYWFVRGTLAHGGQQGWLEEKLGEDLSAVQDPDTNAFSWWLVPLTTSGVDIDFYHKPPTQGWLPWTEDQAPARASAIIRNRCLETGRKIPDMVVFGHAHTWADSGLSKSPRVLFLPGWQLPYDWVHSVGLGMHPKPIGGVILTCRDGRIDVLPRLYRPIQKKRWTIDQL